MTVHFDTIENGGVAKVASVGHARRPWGGVYRAAGKRALDISLVAISAPIVLVLFAIIVTAILATGNRPFFVQERVGRGGQRFRMFKFQTMLPNADALLNEYLAKNPKARAEWNVTQKLCKDPRVTRLGYFLRKSSLDELPQLLNVLAGHMSLVGPRPMMPCQMEMYPGSAYYRLRPGLTGPWQVTSRHASDFRDRAKFDTAYEASMSFKHDFMLLFATIRVVMRGTGC